MLVGVVFVLLLDLVSLSWRCVLDFEGSLQLSLTCLLRMVLCSCTQMKQFPIFFVQVFNTSISCLSYVSTWAASSFRVFKFIFLLWILTRWSFWEFRYFFVSKYFIYFYYGTNFTSVSQFFTRTLEHLQ